METTDFNKLLLQTAFCCMACDGEIAPEEGKRLQFTIAYKIFLCRVA